MLARGYGIEHRELISRILDAAIERVRSEGMREKE
jgi:hypothetical protein